jgi:hypothetical protein
MTQKGIQIMQWLRRCYYVSYQRILRNSYNIITFIYSKKIISYNEKQQQQISPCRGIETSVSRVTGGDTDCYTNTDC